MKTGMVGVSMLMALTMSSFCQADEIQIPFPIKEKMFVREMKKQGMDLNHTDESDGYTQYGPQGFSVITYRPVTFDQMDKIKETAFRCIKDKNFGQHDFRKSKDKRTS